MTTALLFAAVFGAIVNGLSSGGVVWPMGTEDSAQVTGATVTIVRSDPITWPGDGQRHAGGGARRGLEDTPTGGLL